MHTRTWQNQQGQDQYTTEVVLQGFNGVMQMLDSKGAGQTGGFAPQNQQPQQPPQSGGYQQQAPQQQGGFAPQGQQQQAYNKPAQQGGFAHQQQGGYSQQQQGGFESQQQRRQQPPQAPKVNPQEPSIDFDDDIPF